MTIHQDAADGNIEGIRRHLRKRAAVDERDEDGLTPLAHAARSPLAGADVVRLLLEAGADPNGALKDRDHAALELAACSGSLDKVEALLSAGAEIGWASPQGYTTLVNAIYKLQNNPSLIPMVELLIRRGAELDSTTEYGESPLSVASRFGCFDLVQILLDAGADPTDTLGWSPLMQAVALATADDVARALETCGPADVAEDRDGYGRTPLHLAALTDDVRKIELLVAHGGDLTGTDRVGTTPLMEAAKEGRLAALQCLLELGADLEAVDSHNQTALLVAAEAGETESVRVLQDAGANDDHRNQFDELAVSLAANVATARLLTHGEDLSLLRTDVQRRIIGLPVEAPIESTPEEYRTGRTRWFGTLNPHLMNVPHWRAMIRAGCCAYRAAEKFDDTDTFGAGPGWCFDRFGMSLTELPDGRFVNIGGEHEDHYDPDFCIYNDIVIHDGAGGFDILGYPETLFPPTDFHTATLARDGIYIIGGLNYPDGRVFGTTPVYRLDCRTWKIEQVKTTGDNPGWIYGHRARSESPTQIVIIEGKVCREENGAEEHVENKDRFTLDLSTMRWMRDGA